MSATADRRKERAEWKIKRALLHEKRVEFLKESEQFLDNDDDDKETTCTELMQSAAEPIKKKPENFSSIIPGSGDYVEREQQKENSELKDHDNALTQSLELTRSMEKNIVHQKPEPNQTLQIIGSQEILEEVNAEKREWLIALDVAEKARQSAVLFKERDMFNDYNILTGEIKEYSKKFGKHFEGEKNVSEVLPQSEEQSSHLRYSEKSNPNITDMSCEDGVNSSVVENIPINQPAGDINQAASSEDLQSTNVPNNLLCVTFSQTTTQHGEIELSTVKGSSSSNFGLETLKKSFFSNIDLDVDEIDMTTIYQNLRVSVTKPLLTQLELANEAVLRLMLDKHNLFKHIECIRRYFFFIDGEFGRNLTRSLFSEIQVVECPSYVLNVSKLNSLLRSAAIGTSMEEEYTERLSFYVEKVPSVFRLNDPETLDCLSMRYKTYWPLNIVITDEAVVKCDRIFTFLLQLLRTSWALEQDIYLLKDRKLLQSQHFRKVQLYRHIMTHFVTSLKNYVTAVVLEESWYNFKKDFQKSKTLNDVYTAHVKYIKMLSFRSLLNKRSKIVNSYFVKLFSNVLMFHQVLRSGEWTRDQVSGEFQHSCFHHLDHEMNSFLQLAKFLYKYIERLIGAGYQPHLVQLLSLLSGNDFYKQDS